MPQNLWNECLKVLSNKLQKESFSTWLKPTRGLELSEDCLVIGVPNQFVADWLKEHYLSEIALSLGEVAQRQLKPAFRIAAELAEKNLQTELVFLPENGKTNGTSQSSEKNGKLRPHYTFDSFVVGDGNHFARATALAVAEAPGQTRYNPLYIYGGVGLGKTHLVQAVGNFVSGEFPNLRVIYTTSEGFTNEFIHSLGSSKISDFNNLFRQADLLIIDDIQFLAGKEATQIQFFHVFNALHLAGKQIVLTSDRPPKEIKGLEERLLSRFQWGLVTDIQPPDLETRIAILNKKAQADHVTLPADVAEYIAQHFIANVRELEGALIRALAYSSISGTPLDLALAKQALEKCVANGKKEINLEEIIRQIGVHYCISRQDLLSKRKTSEVAWARQVGMFLARDLTSASLKSIGAHFGGRDHSTVIHACLVVKQALSEKPELKQKIDQIVHSLYRE